MIAYDISVSLLKEVLNITKSDKVIIKAWNGKVTVLSQVYKKDMTYYVSAVEESAQVVEPGEVTLTKYLINSMPKDEIISIDGDQVKSDSSIYLAKAKSEGTILEIATPKKLFKIDKSILISTLYAVAKDDTRPILAGVNFKIDFGFLNICALDGYRLALRKEKVEYGEIFDITIPAFAMEAVKRIKGKGEVSIYTTNDGDYVSIQFNNITITTQLLYGSYVKYESLIPTESNTTIQADAQELYNALKKHKGLARVTFDIAGTEIPLKIQLEKSKKVNGKWTTEVIAEVNDKLNVYSFHGTPLTISVNLKYLLEALKGRKGILDITFRSPVSPIVIKRKDMLDNSVDLVLPMRVVKS